MKNFYLYDNRVDIIKNNGSLNTIYFNQNSGKVYFRYKVGTISNVKHPGIFLGTDDFGNGHFLHNHYHYGKACITTEAEFKKGMPIYLYNKKCSNTPKKVIEIALKEAIRGESWKPITYNCQTYTNTACHNVRTSEDADKWVGRVFAASLLLIFLASIGGKR